MSREHGQVVSREVLVSRVVSMGHVAIHKVSRNASHDEHGLFLYLIVKLHFEVI